MYVQCTSQFLCVWYTVCVCEVCIIIHVHMQVPVGYMMCTVGVHKCICILCMHVLYLTMSHSSQLFQAVQALPPARRQPARSRSMYRSGDDDHHLMVRTCTVCPLTHTPTPHPPNQNASFPGNVRGHEYIKPYIYLHR